MVIGVTGYGASGASACVALLKEFDNIQHYDGRFEFQLLQQPDGIRDLKFHLVESRRRISINTAVRRFIKQYRFGRSNGAYEGFTGGRYKTLSEQYVDALMQLKWKGKSAFDPQDVLGILEMGVFRVIGAVIRRVFKFVGIRKPWPPNNTRYYTDISEEAFVSITKKYLQDILVASGFDMEDPIVLEQLFCLEDPTEGAEYFDDYRSIIVERDPRDVYLLTNGYLSDACSFMPNTGDVEAFVAYYKGLHHSKSANAKVYYLRFEDLIYNYEETVQRIESFLGLKHEREREHFKPEQSINNTQVFKKYPQYAEQIRYIEENLAEYLYPFDEMEKNIRFTPEKMEMFDDKPGDSSKRIKANKF